MFALVPPGVVMMMLCAAAACGGDTAVTFVADTTV
jgi:hypothetical protein